MTEQVAQVRRSQLAVIDFIELDGFVIPIATPREAEVALSLLGFEVVDGD